MAKEKPYYDYWNREVTINGKLITNIFTSPVSPGQTVYVIEYLPYPKKHMIRQFVVSFVCHGLNSWVVLDSDLNRIFSDSDWGKTAFSTIEEAESVLQKEIRDDRN